MIDPAQFPKLHRGALYTFTQFGKEWRGRLLYAFNYWKADLDEKGNVIKDKGKWIALRCGFEPELETYQEWKPGELLRVYSVHLEAGRFQIHGGGS